MSARATHKPIGPAPTSANCSAADSFAAGDIAADPAVVDAMFCGGYAVAARTS